MLTVHSAQAERLVVALDAFALSDGSQHRGIGRVVRRMLEDLSVHADVRALASRQVPVPAGVTRVGMHARVPARLARQVHTWELPRAIARSGAQVFHGPGQDIPRRSELPWVQTLYDLTPLVFRHPLLEPDRRRWLAAASCLRKADLVVAVSQSSAAQGVNLLGLDPRRVRVVPLGVDPSFAPTGRAYDPGWPYLLWLTAWGPHKNLSDAITTLEAVAAAGLPHRLVLAGYQDAWMRRQTDGLIEASPVADRIIHAGWVDDPGELYRGADAVLVTSRAEGFGLPALEALACGRVVVAFDNTSLPEVVGEAGLLVPDGDVGAFASAVLRILRDAGLRQELEARGPMRAARFDWTATMRGYLEAYHEVLTLQ
jgi:glycosyltransferase involved in cell wall biosynthesis